MTGAIFLMSAVPARTGPALTSSAKCLNRGWSILLSAPSYAQLGVVLAGFMFTAITIFVASTGIQSRRVLGLLCGAFVNLGFDSYLFSLIAGGNAGKICSRVWGVGMPASGMLAVGGLTVVAAIAWMIVDLPHGPPGSFNLDRISLSMAAGVAVVVTFLLAITTADFLDVAQPPRHNSPSWLHYSPWPAVGAVFLVLVPIYFSRVRGRAWQLLAGPLSRVRLRMRRDSGAVDPRGRWVQISSTLILAYGIIGPIDAGLIEVFSDKVWAKYHLIIVIISVCIGLYLPALLLIALIASFPTVGQQEPAAHNSANLLVGDETVEIRVPLPRHPAEGRASDPISRDPNALSERIWVKIDGASYEAGPGDEDRRAFRSIMARYLEFARRTETPMEQLAPHSLRMRIADVFSLGRAAPRSRGR
jgi:hypothetical protein